MNLKRILLAFTILILSSGCSDPDTVSTQGPEASIVWQYSLEADGIYRTNTETGSTIKIVDELDSYRSMVFTKEWLYYSEGEGLYRINHEQERELLASDTCHDLAIKDPWLYYRNEEGVYRIRLDGTEREQLSSGECHGMAVSENYIFYTIYTPNGNETYSDHMPSSIGELHRMDLDGEHDENLEVQIYGLQYHAGCLYYTYSSAAGDWYLYAMDPDTLELAELHRGYPVEELCFEGRYVYYIFERNLVKKSLDDGSEVQLTKSWASGVLVLDGYVYIHIYNHDGIPPEPGLYKMRVEGGEWQIVNSGD